MVSAEGIESARTIDEQILYRLSLDFRSHELAEALLERRWRAGAARACG
jgi:hypothetical protein